MVSVERWRRCFYRRPLTYLSAGVAAAAAAVLVKQLLTRDGSDDSETVPREAIRFQLDANEEFYAFVFRYDAVCVAHGRVPANVGKTLFEIHSGDEVDADELHDRFVRTAQLGGGWVAYPKPKGESTLLRLKGAYVVPVTVGGRPCYAAVGYALSPGPKACAELGLYGFATDLEGRFVAHGASPSNVGLTLAEVCARTNNAVVDPAAMLDKFRAAVGLGGGWLAYPWRNHRDAPMLTKGCYVVKLNLGGSDTRLRNSASFSSRNASYASFGALASLAEGHAETDGEAAPSPGCGVTGMTGLTRTLVVGVGYFGGSTDGDAVPKWRSAAMGATLVLQRQLHEAWRLARVNGTSLDDAIASAVMDDHGILAAAAAEALCQEDTGDMPHMVSVLLQPSRSARALGLYGVVFDSSGRFIAHGGSPEFVGRTIGDVVAQVAPATSFPASALARRRPPRALPLRRGERPAARTASQADVDEPKLLQRFLAAARRGGGWVTYAYRSSPEQPMCAKVSLARA